MQLLCQLTGILDRRVVFLIWRENISLSVQAECLMEHPGAVFGIFFLTFIIRLVPAAGELLSVSQIHREAKLFCLSGMDVEEGDRVSENCFRLTVFHCDKVQFRVKGEDFIFLQQFLSHIPEQLDHFVVSVDIDIFSALFCKIAGKHTHHPDNTEDMVDMLVCDKDRFDIADIYICTF